jgi:hypothetical protein
MGIRWEKLVGDTSKFAIKLAFSDDPDLGEGATREESASWGSLQIWVSDANICAHHTQGELGRTCATMELGHKFSHHSVWVKSA